MVTKPMNLRFHIQQIYIEDEYYDDQQNPKWDSEYPLIKIWYEELDKWEADQNTKYDNEQYLRKCPLCRA